MYFRINFFLTSAIENIRHLFQKRAKESAKLKRDLIQIEDTHIGVSINHKKFSKQRKYNLYSKKQINETARLIEEFQYQDYDRIASITGIQISMVMKIASNIKADQPLRRQRIKKDSIDELSDAQKDKIISQFLDSEYISMNLTKKVQKFNEVF